MKPFFFPDAPILLIGVKLRDNSSPLFSRVPWFTIYFEVPLMEETVFSRKASFVFL
jgi:hypothetical protein